MEKHVKKYLSEVLVGPRDTKNYLQVSPDSPASVIAIIGGMGFLYQLNENVKELHLVDINAKQITYCSLILKLIDISSDIYQFLSLLSCKKVLKNKSLDKNITDVTYSWQSFLQDRLTHEQLIMYERIYWNRDKEHVEYFKEFSEISKLFKYYWGFGKKDTPFFSNDSFIHLQQLLRKIPIHFYHDKIQNINFAHIKQKHPNLELWIFVTNADRDYFTKSDNLLHEIIKKAKDSFSITYISWSRKLKLNFQQHHSDCVEKLVAYTKGRDVIETKTYRGYSFTKDELNANSLMSVDINEFFAKISLAKTVVSKLCFLYHISLPQNVEYRKNKILSFFNAIRGQFDRIIIIDHKSFLNASVWIAWLEEIDFRYSYRIDNIEWSGGKTGFDRNVIIVYSLRGSK